jgi:hypothetical protein
MQRDEINHHRCRLGFVEVAGFMTLTGWLEVYLPLNRGPINSLGVMVWSSNLFERAVK